MLASFHSAQACQVSIHCLFFLGIRLLDRVVFLLHPGWVVMTVTQLLAWDSSCPFHLESPAELLEQVHIIAMLQLEEQVFQVGENKAQCWEY